MNATNTQGNGAATGIEYSEALDHVTGFQITPFGTAQIFIRSGYTGMQKCNYSEVMMHMRRSDKTMKFRFTVTDHGTWASESVQLLNADGSHWSGPVTRGEGGVYHEGHTGRYYYHLPITEMTDEYAAAMATCDESYRRDCAFGYSTTREGDQWAAEQKEIDRLAAKYCLHPTVLHDICEYAIQLQNNDRTWDADCETQELSPVHADTFDDYEPAHSTDQPMKDMAD